MVTTLSSGLAITILLATPLACLGQGHATSGDSMNYRCYPTPGIHKSPPCYDFDGVRRLIRRELTERAVPSMAVAVAKDGRILWEEGFGFADRENRIPASAQTLYSLASLTKPYTATGVLELVAAGKIRLDAPIDEYIAPAKLTYRGDFRHATVRDLLAHTAGLPTFVFFHYKNACDSMVSMVETMRRYGVVTHPPGTIWEYSNLGYGILDWMTARISGLTWPEYMRRRVFLPLGLRHTSVGVSPELRALAAPRYDDQTHRRLPPFDFDHRGASAIYASVHDVIRFGMFQLKDHLPDQRPILADSEIDTMMRLANGESVSGVQHKTRYGLGWQLETDAGYETVGHEGAMVGSTAILKLFPSENLAIAVLTNTFDESAVIDVQQEIAAAVLPAYAEARRAAAPHPAPKVSTPDTAPKLPDELIGHWSGTLYTWQSTIPMTLDFRPGGDIHVKLGDQVESLVSEVRYQGGNLTGRFAASILTDDAVRHPHTVALNVWLQHDQLRGEASAITWDTQLFYFWLPSYLELSKAALGK